MIHWNHLLYNIEQIRRRAPGKKICAPVKADAYGHGALPVARFLKDHGVEVLAVATVDEGLELRQGGIEGEILLLGHAMPEELPDLIQADLSAVVSDLNYLQALGAEAQRQGRRGRVHLKVDVGMGRLGCQPQELLPLAKALVMNLHLEWEGLFTHFPSSDNGLEEPTRSQIGLFKNLIRDLKAQGLTPKTIHAANSGAILDFPESHFDMVRPGIILYGYLPDQRLRNPGEFRPVMEVVTRIMHLKTLPSGAKLSYGGTYETPQQTQVATLPIGYADGYFRSFSNRAPVSCQGQTFRVSGRVCMDQILVDLGPDLRVQVGDEVRIFGAEGPTAQDLADLAQTIPYEITCAVSRRVPRIYLP